MSGTNKKAYSNERQFKHTIKIHRDYEVVQKSIRTLISEAKELELLERTTHNTSANTYTVWFKSIQLRKNVKLIRMDLDLVPNIKNDWTLAFMTFTYKINFNNVKDRFSFFVLENNLVKAFIVRKGRTFKRRVEVWM